MERSKQPLNLTITMCIINVLSETVFWAHYSGTLIQYYCITPAKYASTLFTNYCNLSQIIISASIFYYLIELSDLA